MITATQTPHREDTAGAVLDPEVELRGPRERLEDAVGSELAQRLVTALSAAGDTRRSP
jgi:hypothetical protein